MFSTSELSRIDTETRILLSMHTNVRQDIPSACNCHQCTQTLLCFCKTCSIAVFLDIEMRDESFAALSYSRIQCRARLSVSVEP